MTRRWTLRTMTPFVLGMLGCAQVGPLPAYVEVERNLQSAVKHPPGPIHPDEPMAVALDPVPAPPEFAGEQPVDAFIRRALAENRGVQAARFNVLAMKERIPQVTALEDPMVENTIWPFPMNGPQYSLMGYNPYQMIISQQFPWFGTLRLRGEAAEQEVKVALMELAAAQLEVVAEVKRAYYDLYFAQRSEQILAENRKLAVDFVEIARVRFTTGNTSQQDVLRAENVVTDVESELVTARQGIAEARAALARQLHVSPETAFRTLPTVPTADVPAQVDRLYRLAVVARPELQGRLAAVVRDTREVELARKKYYPNIDVGLNYMTLTRDNAMSPTADGRDMVGLTVGFNLPVYRGKLAAGVREAEARAVANSRRYDNLRDETYEAVKSLLAEATSRRDVIDLFRSGYLPRSRQALEIAASDYRAGNLDFLTLVTAWRELLQVELQIARFESELGRALAQLERVVGCQLNEHPPSPASAATVPDLAPPPPAADEPGPFEPAADEPAPDGNEAPGESAAIRPPARDPAALVLTGPNSKPGAATVPAVGENCRLLT
ncbi:TolC family protein [Planctomyces sp. SH-PL62]|uniref:TolC family protein n=1 Tax=Planctomyces sp. SH-PL62 TaxID=1636152 RepID=UPI00078C8161|nr:TolC family protein [Planctomyces sp. SH-PL62]AMV38107.1 putative outer membrane efflux protein MdtP [Planctomyces sp. SH-PL62]